MVRPHQIPWLHRMTPAQWRRVNWAACHARQTDRQTPRTSVTIICISCIRCSLKMELHDSEVIVREHLYKAAALWLAHETKPARRLTGKLSVSRRLLHRFVSIEYSCLLLVRDEQSSQPANNVNLAEPPSSYIFNTKATAAAASVRGALICLMIVEPNLRHSRSRRLWRHWISTAYWDV